MAALYNMQGGVGCGITICEAWRLKDMFTLHGNGYDEEI